MKMAALAAAVLAACLGIAAAQPFLAGTGFAPLGNLRTTDQGAPNGYNVSLLGAQIAEIKVIDFLSGVECLEGQFDTWGTFGRGFIGNLSLGGPTPVGARKANLTERTLPYLEEVALNEQGHALFTRHAGSMLPCPVIDFTGGFNKFMAAAFELPEGTTVKKKFGADYDPFLNDQNFVLSVLSLEELGATGNKGLALLLNNPVHAAAVAGLATSATAQATVERFLLWQLREEIIEPFNETAQQVFARVSALRDRLDGPQLDDQGIVNTDPRFIAVPNTFVNLIPTDVHGLTFGRTPQMNINILTLGAADGKGRIRLPTGFDKTASGLDDFPASAKVSGQESVSALGKLPKPVTAAGPKSVKGELQLTQTFDLNGNLTDNTPNYRGYLPVPANGSVHIYSSTPVDIGKERLSSSSDSSSAGRKLLMKRN